MASTTKESKQFIEQHRAYFIEKRCSRCRLFKYPEDFRFSSSDRDRRSRSCTVCENGRGEKYRKNNVEQLKITRKTHHLKDENKKKRNIRRQQWRKENRAVYLGKRRENYRKNAESRREKRRQYTKDNPEIILAASILYREENKEKIKEANRKQRLKNPDRAVLDANKRRARIASAPENDLTQAQWDFIKETFHHCCAYCGKKQKRLTQDHITPITKNGRHTASNIVPACRSCNSKKRTGPPLVPVQPILKLGF